MIRKFTSDTQKTGELGEDIACIFLQNKGFIIKERNYTRRYGEIDIIAEKNRKLFFIEVKSKSVVNNSFMGNVPQETDDVYMVEDNMHPWKLKRLARVIQAYLFGKNVPPETDWQLDLLVVYLDATNRKARVKVVKDIILC